jgi:hypothetical protein
VGNFKTVHRSSMARFHIFFSYLYAPKTRSTPWGSTRSCRKLLPKVRTSEDRLAGERWGSLQCYYGTSAGRTDKSISNIPKKSTYNTGCRLIVDQKSHRVLLSFPQDVFLFAIKSCFGQKGEPSFSLPSAPLSKCRFL